MVDFGYELISQIKNADDEVQLRKLIEGFVQNAHPKNIGGAGAKRRFMMNMIMALRYVRAEGLNDNAAENVNAAIDILEGQRKLLYSNLF
jgi:hypothetical protein